LEDYKIINGACIYLNYTCLVNQEFRHIMLSLYKHFLHTLPHFIMGTLFFTMSGLALRHSLECQKTFQYIFIKKDTRSSRPLRWAPFGRTFASLCQYWFRICPAINAITTSLSRAKSYLQLN